jgi:hypothetical protein
VFFVRGSKQLPELALHVKGMEVTQHERKEAANWSAFLILIFIIRNRLSFVCVIICDYKIGEDNSCPYSNANYIFWRKSNILH